MLPTLKPQDVASRAIDWMEEFRVSQLALVENGEYKGIIEEDFVLDAADQAMELSEVQPINEGVFAFEHQHLYELLGIVQQHGLEILPVLDENHHYSGSIQVNNLLRKLADSLGVQESGAIIELQMENRDYSLTEVSRLVESNDTKIISSYYTDGTYDGESPGVLTLKLNRKEVTSVIATLERFGYYVLAVHGNSSIETPDRERLDLLLKYLEFWDVFLLLLIAQLLHTHDS